MQMSLQALEYSLSGPDIACVLSTYSLAKQLIMTPDGLRLTLTEEPAMARYMCLMGTDDGYETVQVPERKLATFGVDIAKLEEWIEEDLTGQRRLPGVG